MSKHKEPKRRKKVVVTTETASKKRITPTTRSRGTSTEAPKEMLFGKENYILMGSGLGLIFLGMILMMGGGMPNPETWDPDIIYSFRRTVLAPFVILVGLGIEIYAIFK